MKIGNRKLRNEEKEDRSQDSGEIPIKQSTDCELGMEKHKTSGLLRADWLGG